MLELLIEADDQVLPTRVHAIVLVSKVHKPTMRALAYGADDSFAVVDRPDPEPGPGGRPAPGDVAPLEGDRAAASAGLGDSQCICRRFGRNRLCRT